ncbi:MAG TPA: hypothetical protein VF491_01160 [Vicinamibacterales bacterium]
MMERMDVAILVAVAVMVFAAPIGAVSNPPVAVPEISGASLSSGLALLGAGALWLRARRGAKK